MNDLGKDFKEKLEEIRKDEEINKWIQIAEDEIKKSEDLIENYEKEIKEEYNKGFKVIEKIRKINEKEQNHKDNLICNELKENYKKKLEELNEQLDKIIENNLIVEKEKNKMIIKEINNIEEKKSSIIEKELERNNKIKKEIEKTKYESLIKYGNYIYDDEKNKKLIEILEQLQ